MRWMRSVCVASILDEAIERLYRAFSDEPRPAIIEACPCCVTQRELQILASTKLREITAEQLAGYASSVTLTAGSEGDFRYLLPRILDVSMHDEDWWPDHEVICSNLARANWFSWPGQLKDSIIGLFSVALEVAISGDDGWKADELICGFALAGLEVGRFLRRLEAEDAAKTLVKFYERNSQSLMKGKLGNAFWRDHKAEARPVIEWFVSPHVVSIINGYYGLE